MKPNSVLLIGGAGAIGTYTSKELANLGCHVDVICLETLENTERIHYITQAVTYDFLCAFLAGRRNRRNP